MSRHKQYLRGLGLSEGEMEELTAETTPVLCVGREVTADYKQNKSADGSRTYRNLNNIRPAEDLEPEDTSIVGSLL